MTDRRITSIKALLESIMLNIGTITLSQPIHLVVDGQPVHITIDSIPALSAAITSLPNLNIASVPALSITSLPGITIASLPTLNITQAITTSTPTMTQVNVAASSVTLLPANANRKKVEIRNQHTSGDIYFYFGTPATLTNSKLLLNGESYEFPQGFVYTGIITAISANAISKPVSVVEWT